MRIREMTVDDIRRVVPIYIEYYNEHEESYWTEETATRRITQVLTMDGGYALIMEDGGQVLGFVMGYLKQYDDLVGYMLEEILIASAHQHRGLGTRLLAEVEARVREKGASLVELSSVNDALHDGYYGKAGYYKATSLIPRGKWLGERAE